jgi:hypothetical protein
LVSYPAPLLWKSREFGMMSRLNGNGVKSLLWIAGAIGVCIVVSVFLYREGRAQCAAGKTALEKRMETQYEAIRDDLKEIKRDIKDIISK